MTDAMWSPGTIAELAYAETKPFVCFIQQNVLFLLRHHSNLNSCQPLIWIIRSVVCTTSKHFHSPHCWNGLYWITGCPLPFPMFFVFVQFPFCRLNWVSPRLCSSSTIVWGKKTRLIALGFLSHMTNWNWNQCLTANALIHNCVSCLIQQPMLCKVTE